MFRLKPDAFCQIQSTHTPVFRWKPEASHTRQKSQQPWQMYISLVWKSKVRFVCRRRRTTGSLRQKRIRF